MSKKAEENRNSELIELLQAEGERETQAFNYAFKAGAESRQAEIDELETSQEAYISLIAMQHVEIMKLTEQKEIKG